MNIKWWYYVGCSYLVCVLVGNYGVINIFTGCHIVTMTLNSQKLYKKNENKRDARLTLVPAWTKLSKIVSVKTKGGHHEIY